jgi:hypothetical protein
MDIRFSAPVVASIAPAIIAVTGLVSLFTSRNREQAGLLA